MSKTKPAQIGRYKIIEELGRGGFGCVYRAYDPTVDRPVAVKVLTQVSKDMLTRFRNEATVAGNLRHNNIVTVYEYGTHDEVPFLAMEYLEGDDLNQIITSRMPLTILEKCNIMLQVAEGLHSAHTSGVVHRDIKPANIMLLRGGTVKIMDFGIARLTNNPDATRLTQHGYLVGTPRYMAPEQLAGSEFDSLCDIFAYGVIFYELITGRHPFEAADAQSLIYKLTFVDPPPIHDFAPNVPAALERVIAKTLQKDRTLRYQSLKEVQFDTEPIRIELQKERAAGLLVQARELFSKEQLDPAQKVVQEVLELEPSNREARDLWELLQKQLQQRTLQPRIELSLKSGEEHLTQRRFTDALMAFESAIRLDRDNVYIQGRIEHARGLAEHASKASRLLAEARREFEQQNITDAYRTVAEALRHDPQNPEAAEFLQTIQSVLDRRQAEQRLEDAIRKAQGLVLIPAYDEAITLLTGLGPDGDSPKIRAILEWVRKEKDAHERKQKLHEGMAAATELLRGNRPDEATKCLERLKAEFPENPEVSQLLSYAREETAAQARAKAIDGVVRQADAMCEARNFEGALAALDGALKNYPGESVLIRLLGSTMSAKSAWERQCAVQAALSKCESLRSEGRYGEAIETVEATLRDYDAEPGLLSLLRQLQADRTRQRREEELRKTREEAEALLEQGQPKEALQTVQQALVRHPGEPSLQAILRRATKEVAAQKRAEAIEMIATAAAQRAGANEFDIALRMLQQGLEKWPADPQLTSQRAATVSAKRVWEQRQKHIEERARVERPAPLVIEAADDAKTLIMKAPPVQPVHTVPQTSAGAGRAIQPPPEPSAAGLWKRGRIPALIGLAMISGAIIIPRIHKGSVEVPVSRTADVRGPSASREGAIAPKQETVKVEPGLVPQPQTIQVNTNFESGQVYLDGRRAGDLQEGQYALSGITAGQHTIRVTAGHGTNVETGFRSVAGATPELLRLKASKDVLAAVVSSSSSKGSITCTCDVRQIALDGAPAVAAPSAPGTPAALGELKEGTHQITLQGRSLVVDVRPNPTLNIFLLLDRNRGAEKAVPVTLPRNPPQPDTSAGARGKHDGVAPSAVEQPASPRKEAPPDPKVVEAQDWNQIAGSTNADDFDAFIRNHAGSPHLEQARNRAADLRRQAQVNMARATEQAAWDKVDQNKKEQLQDYLSHYPAGIHAQGARTKIAEIERQATEALAAQRAKELKDREQATRAADEKAILAILKEFESAYNAKDLATLQRLWRGVPVAAYRQQFREARDLKFQLQVLGQPALNDNGATAICTRTLSYRGQAGGPQTHSERVRVTLSRGTSGWLIASIDLN